MIHQNEHFNGVSNNFGTNKQTKSIFCGNNGFFHGFRFRKLSLSNSRTSHLPKRHNYMRRYTINAINQRANTLLDVTAATRNRHKYANCLPSQHQFPLTKKSPRARELPSDNDKWIVDASQVKKYSIATEKTWRVSRRIGENFKGTSIATSVSRRNKLLQSILP